MRYTLILTFVLLTASVSSAQTRYVDFVNGSDLFDGTSKTHTSGTIGPWKSSPYMTSGASCSDNSGVHFGYSHVAGQRIIFKGGVTWPAACFHMNILLGGNSTNQDYYGVDLTWFSGSSFTKPVFDLNFTVPQGSQVVTGAVTTAGFGFITFDGFEIKHQAITVTLGIDQQQAYSFRNFSNESQSPLGIIITNNFIHGWGSTTTLTSSNQGDYAAGSIRGNVTVDHTEISDADGWMVTSGTPAHFGGAVVGVTNNVGNSEVRFSKIHDTMAGCFNVRSCHDNEFYNQGQPTGDPGGALVHSQVIEDDDGWGPSHVYNNLLHDINAGVLIDVCQGAQIYNNVIYNYVNNFGIRLAGTGSGSCGAAITNPPSNIMNNTVVCTASTAPTCFGTDSHTGAAVTGAVNLQNNLWISFNTAPVSINEPITGTFTNTNNLRLDSTTATNDGYTVANKFQPISSSSPTVGFGTNLTASCGGHLAALCTDPRGAPWSGSVGVARPVNTGTGTCGGVASITPCWDGGAYQFSGTAGPSAPSGLTGTVAGSTVSLSWTASSGSPVPTGYTLYRGTVHNGPYIAVQSGITSLSTTDTPANGTYFYVVTAFVGGVVSTISGNGTTATVTCMTACAFPSGTVFTIAGDSQAAFNGTFTSTGQPTNSSFTFSSSSSAVGSGGGVWKPASESPRSNEVQAIVPSAITFSFAPASLTFASTTVGSPSGTQTVTVTNTSSAGSTVTFSSVSFTGINPGDFSRTTNCTTLTTPGQQCTTVVTFTPTAAGARSASLTFVDNATGSPQTVPVSGTGVAQTPLVTLSPTSLDFGQQTLSVTSTVRSIVLTNTGSGTLTITSVVASGDFAVTTVPATNCGTTLASLATCSLNVTFTPTATGGRTGAVTVMDNAAGSPHVANLQGVGITTKCSLTNTTALSGMAVVCGP